MRSILCLLLLSSSAIASCPSQYMLIENKCVRPLFLEQKMVWDDQVPASRITCGYDGATMPIIHSYTDNEMYSNIANSFSAISGKNIYIVLDNVCNPNTRRLEWVDGTYMNWLGKGVTNDFDCVKEDHKFISRVQKDDWDWINAYKEHTLTIFCVRDPIVPTTAIPTTKLVSTVKPTCPPCHACPTTTTFRPTTTVTTPRTTPLPLSDQCGDYEIMSNSTDTKETCVKLYTDRQSWEIAQKTCTAQFGSLVTINSAEENKYFWRLAVSSNIMDGIHIGAHQSSKDPRVWTWVDGEVPIEGKSYDNFMDSFPIPGAGECGSMLTDSSSAYWINEDCSNNKQAFFCRRQDFSGLPKTCPKETPAAVEDVISPGFPNSAIPCDYVLFVAANKLVEIEIVALVTDVGNDFLEIFEGSSGSNLIASFTGTILASNKMRTAKSNVMRVNWSPQGQGINRGFKIRYYEVDP